MPTIPDTYRLRAAEARDAAELAPLETVRDIHLRAAATWDAMAARATRTHRRRAEDEAAKAAREDAEPEPTEPATPSLEG